jgi:hypothetical protein
VNFGGRGNKGKTKRAIKGKPQNTSADYWFLGPAAWLPEQPLLSLCGNKDFFAFTSPVPCFNSLK